LIPNLIRPDVVVIEDRYEVIKIMGEVVVAACRIQTLHDQQEDGEYDSDQR